MPTGPYELRPRGSGLRAPGGVPERARFDELQRRLAPLFERILADPRAPRTVVVLPSLSLDPEVLGALKGLLHYEERLLCLLMLLRLPNTRVVYLSSQPIHPWIVDYYLQLLPGVPRVHALRRLVLLSAFDGSTRRTLTGKVLDRPRLQARLRAAIGDPSLAHLSCFNVTPGECALAVRLGVPIYGCDPVPLGVAGKSGSRRVFREAGVLQPDGLEHLRDVPDVEEALCELKRRAPTLRKAVVKLDRGTSGLGNATFGFEGAPQGDALRAWVRAELPRRLEFGARGETWERYRAKFERLGGVVECWIEGEPRRSPSVQGRVTALGEVELISTHDQVLGGPCGQTFLGSLFPADDAYRREVQEIGLRIGRTLRGHGVLGRYGVDFVSVRGPDGWRHHAIENNIRKGGTTHTFRTLQLLTDGACDPETGLFRTADGAARSYWASDNLVSDAYRRLTPEDLVDIAVAERLHFHASTGRGVVFHLLGALSEHGKLGLVCVDRDRESACALGRETVAVLDREAARDGP